MSEQLGLILKDNGMELALAPINVQDWKEQFQAAARHLAATGQHFTSEDLIAIAGLPNEGIATNANNAVGALMNALARKGVIRKTSERRQSKRPTSHGAELIVWVGTPSIGET